MGVEWKGNRVKRKKKKEQKREDFRKEKKVRTV